MYITRYVEEEIKKALKSSGAVLVTGPRFSGKTTTCMLFQKSYIKLNTSDVIKVVSLNPKSALNGEKPHLIDEWQTVPDIWGEIKNSLDDNYVFGSYLLTGSSTPVNKSDIFHTAVGRITEVKMETMSLFESGDSDGRVSLRDLFNNQDLDVTYLENSNTLHDIAYLICRGGWPISVVASKEIALDVTRNYYNSLFFFENLENEAFRGLKPETLRRITRSYARNISTEASLETIKKDLGEDGIFLDIKTFNKYIEALNDIFIFSDLEAWNPNIRSKTSIRTTPTRHFVDTSIALSALGLSAEDLMKNLKSFGLFFEDMAVRDLRIYARSLSGELRHYRDNTGLECDAVIHLRDGKWGAIEIKLGGDENIEEGASSLKRLKKKIEEKSEISSPAFLLVLTAVGKAYKRKDEVYVVPITSLKA